MRGLDGKTVIVTGGGGGIGSATCRRFGTAGARVAVLDLFHWARKLIFSEKESIATLFCVQMVAFSSLYLFHLSY